jgi:hypothetical protein
MPPYTYPDLGGRRRGDLILEAAGREDFLGKFHQRDLS